jgi:hypothetical protein
MQRDELSSIDKEKIIDHAFNTILIHLKPHIGIKSNPGDSTGSGLLSSESPADLEFDSSDSSDGSAGMEFTFLRPPLSIVYSD